jgi:predicted site-specific integrase-resolvase
MYGVSSQALRRWSNQKLIEFVKTPGGNRLYNAGDLSIMFGKESYSKRSKVCYARVSSEKQKEDLKRQIEALKGMYPEHEIISDIGSGLNFKRRGFVALLERVHKGEIEEICVLYKDRLCRFGIELVEFICQKANTKILVHSNQDKIELGNAEELSQDLLSIITVFVARNNGLRAGRNRKLREQAQKKDKTGGNEGNKTKAIGRKVQKDSSVSQ